MEAPCRKRLALASRFCALWVLTLFAILLVASQGSAQSPFVVLPEDLQPQQIPTGTFFRIQLSANFPAAYTIASAVGIDKSSFELTPTSVLQSTRALTLNTPAIIVIITATDDGGTLRASRTYTIFVVANTQGIPLFYNLTRSDGYDASVPEDAVGGTEVTRVYAAVPGGGVPILSFLPPSLVFFIQGSRVLVGADGNLDRETTSFYNLTIQAKNGEEYNYTQIFINVTDINDKDPTIESGQIGYLYATDPANTLVIMFNASDADIGINKELTYSIIAGIEKDHFRIDAATGYIYINVAAVQLPPSLNLTIQVVDGGTPSRSSTGVLDIEVLVANNSAPVFINSPYSLTINESAAVPSQIFLAEANDTDPNVAGQITFSLSAVPTVNGQPIFSINQDSGWISLIQPLDFELKVTYEFNITATDRHRRKPQAAMTYITISILDVNDNNPKFSQSSYMYDLSENTSVNHLIVDLSMFASDEDTLASGDLSFYFYPPIDNSFRLDSTNGELRLNQTLSRKTQPNHVLYIFAEDAGNPRLRGNTTIYIRVIEVNDYVPQINIPSQIDVFETNGTKVNQPFYFINVTDPDGGPSGNVTLSITSGDSTLFRVQPYQHGLYYTRALDYESVSVRSWTITITARDAGDPVFSTNKTLTINLQDWNEYAPVFSRDRYAGGVDLSTTTPTGTALVQVSATDADGLFNKVTYQITAGQNSTEFTINPATGLIANGAIGISQTQNFTLTVTATDNGIPFQRNASVEVEIRVLRSENVNDPVFAQEYFNVSIFENLPVGTQIAQVNASDKDQGEAGSVFYVQQSSLNDFYVDPGSGNVTTRRVFDFENGPRVFVIVVQARDRGAFRPRTSPIPASIEVHIINVNDRPPVFVLAPYTGSVAEDDAVNTTLSQKVLATDADGPQHPAGIVRYSIAPGGGSVDFRIDSVTGVLSIAMPLDHERQASYSLTIVATDGATVPMNATAQYTIQVTDVNDNTPVFYLPLVRSVAIDEEMPAGTFLTRVAANDSDSQLAGMVTYSIDPAWFSLFRVNASTGVLTTAVKLNRETSQGNYNVTVHATDGGSPARRASIVIAVTVNDINDMAPHFSSPFYTASTPEAVPNGQLVAMVSATDGDIDIAHRMVTYSIVGGTGQLLFAVNMVNGDITKVGRLDFETVKAYTLIVNATDGMFTDLTLVTILISDSNDNNPYFNQSLYRASVSENSPAGTFVVRVFVLDADTLQDDVGVSFSLVTPAVPFAVNTQSGVITANGSLDYDILPREYNITVACHPLTNLSVTYNTTVVWISLLPLNDNSPVFNPFRILVSVFENAPPGIIAVVDATDADVPAAQLTYSLATAFSNSLNDSEIRATFRVDSATGAVSTTKALDRERITAVVTLTITASDGANLGAAFLYVSVNDVIDTAPAFPRSVYSYTIIENTSPHLIIATLRAVDGETNDRLTYAINDTAALPYFSIGQLDGQLRLIRTLNRENRDKWVFNVTATDLLNLVGVTTVDITVSDYNNQVPQFVGAGSYSVSVSEAASVGLNIGLQLRATDGDINSNAQFSFSTTGGAGSSDFSVNPVTGVMSIRQPLDRERQSFYSIQVTVTDLGIPPLNSSMNVNITIIDVNDESPVMNRTTYDGYVDENSPVGTPVLVAPNMNLMVAASDADQPGNNNSVIRFVLDLPQVPFMVNSVTGLITVSGRLDREAHPEPYVVQIRARDTVGTGLVSEPAVITITLVDEDDSPPVFSQLSYSATVLESAPNGTSLVQVRTTDRDLGSNRNVSYQIIAGNINRAFAINSLSGLVYKAGVLDFELAQEHVLTVEAVDTNNVSLTDTAIVTIQVTDFNDRVPVFYPSNVYAVSIDETNNTDFFVIQVFANDTDQPGTDNTRIRYSLINSFNNTFKMDAVTGRLRTAKAIDYESLPVDLKHFSVPVLAMDMGDTRLSSRATITVTILDVNDNYPIFSAPSYSRSIHENVMVGMSVIQVQAMDRDSSSNGAISYTLAVAGNSDDTFRINSFSGVIELNSTLDFEDRTQFPLVVIASDMGSPVRRSTIAVDISVIDVNDVVPLFSSDLYSATIPESTVVNSSILTVFASDRDSGNHSAIVYSLQNTAGNTFAINTTTGELTLQSTLDYDSSLRFYRLVVVAHVSFGIRSGQLNGFSNITISVTDSNDLPPVFNQSVYRTEVAANASIGSVIYRFSSRVTDADTAPANKQLTYRLLPGGTFGQFQMNSSTGEVFTVDSLNLNQRYFYNLTVEVIDGPHMDSALFEVSIDVRPVFVVQAYSVVVTENFNVSDTILTVLATEETWDSSGVASTIQYFIRSGNALDLFGLNANTGYLTLANELDFESNTAFSLSVQAVDSKGRTSDLVQVSITVTNVNEFRPVFLKDDFPGVAFTPAGPTQYARYTITIAEGLAAPIQSQIAKVAASDADAASNGPVVFALVAGNSEQKFYMRGPDLFLNAPLDFEGTKMYNLNISASDNGVGNPLVTFATIQVTVADINDNAPRFNQSQYAVDVYENTVYFSFVIKMLAVDTDSGAAGIVRYSIAGDDGKFSINTIDGIVRTTASQLDRELKSLYTLLVTAFDLSNQSFASTVQVFVTVLDRSDEILNFTSPTYTKEVPEVIELASPPDDLLVKILLPYAATLTAIVIVVIMIVIVWRSHKKKQAMFRITPRDSIPMHDRTDRTKQPVSRDSPTSVKRPASNPTLH